MLEVRGAARDDLNSAAECIGRAFDNGDEDRYNEIRTAVASTARSDPFATLEDLRVGIVDGEVVSATAVVPRPVYMGGVELSMGGIAAVCTRESHRGRGYNTAVLKNALAYIERQGHDISLLYTGIHGYYERLGWRTFNHGVGHDVSAPAELRPSGFGGSVRPMRPDADLPAVRAIYGASNRDKAGPVARTAAYWAYHADRLQSYHVAVDDGQVVAYLHHTDGRRIEETGSLPGHEVAEAALVGDVLARSGQGSGPVNLSGSEHIADTLRCMGCQLARLGTGPQKRPMPTMYRVMRLGPLVDKLLPRMSERLAASPAASGAGVVRLQSEAGAVDMQYRAGVVTHGAADAAPSITLDASHAQTIELVFGQIDAASLVVDATDPGADIEDILTALFPRLTYAYYGPDTF